MLLEALAKTSELVAATRGRKAKVVYLAQLLGAAPEAARAIAARYLAGDVAHKLGVGHAMVAEVRTHAALADAASLTLVEVDARFAALVGLSGSGSSSARRDQLGSLFARATAVEQTFLAALILGELRQGALDALVVDALGLATGVPAKAIRTAYMLAGELGTVAAAVLGEGLAGLARFGLTVGTPVLPMLAQTAESPAEALSVGLGEGLGAAGGALSFEYKLDGFRVQIHKAGETIRVYSRALNDVTSSVPEVVAATRALAPQRLILDGEALAYGPTGRPLPFQDTMSRKTIDGSASGLRLSLFDVLLVDDQTLLGVPARERFEIIERVAPIHAIPRLITGEAAAADEFYARALAAGHEGVMAKSLEAPYDAGSRGAAWMKIKRVRRLDLVIVAAEWGSGRRKGKLSNLHLGARDPGGSGFVMLGKTFKGLTDATLAWQTVELLARQVDRDGHVIHVRPELVAEIAFNDVLRSSQYPGGLALRHARVVRYRDDKTAAEADTIDTVRAFAIADGVL